MKQVIATIGYVYTKVLKLNYPEALKIELRKPTYLPVELSTSEISKVLNITENLKHKTILLLTVSICKVVDCMLQTYQTVTNSKRATTVEFTAISVIIYIHC